MRCLWGIQKSMLCRAVCSVGAHWERGTARRCRCREVWKGETCKAKNKPGLLETLARSLLPVMRLRREDLPTLEWPMKANSGPTWGAEAHTLF